MLLAPGETHETSRQTSLHHPKKGMKAELPGFRELILSARLLFPEEENLQPSRQDVSMVRILHPRRALLQALACKTFRPRQFHLFWLLFERNRSGVIEK